jgi:PmbA protein
VVGLWGNRQFSQYLGLTDSFIASNFVIEGGKSSAEEIRRGDYLEIVEFSDFQVDAVTGDIAGEIRLGYLHRGNETVSVSGGSVSGNMSELIPKMAFSAESRQYDCMRIPAVTRLNGATVTGAV